MAKWNTTLKVEPDLSETKAAARQLRNSFYRVSDALEDAVQGFRRAGECLDAALHEMNEMESRFHRQNAKGGEDEI